MRARSFFAFVRPQADRRVNYERVAKETGEKWLPVVKNMRKQAEKGNLRFPLNAPTKHNVSTAGLAASFKPEGAMEDEIARVLREGGLDDKGIAREEERQLKLNKLSKGRNCHAAVLEAVVHLLA